MTTLTIPRGMRNNNPFNIDFAQNTHWLGQLGRETLANGQPGRFVRFDSMAHGLRAGAKVLLTYFREHGLHTVSGIIGRFAPEQDHNDTGSYGAFVAAALDVGINDDIPVDNPATLARLLRAITRVEGGKNPAGQWYSDLLISNGDINAAVDLALGGGS